MRHGLPLILLLAAACGASETDGVPYIAAMPVTTTAPPTTVPPVAPKPTVATKRAQAPPRATRSHTAPVPVPVGTHGSMDAAFWRRLANCESSDGRSGRYKGYFQFSSDTAQKVGWFDGATYDEQAAMAQRWLAMIGGPSRGGTRSGWPVCWWRALR